MYSRKMEARLIYSRTLGQVVKTLRKRVFRRTQKRFGKLCGVSQKTLSNWENMKDFSNFNVRSLFGFSWSIGAYPSEVLRFVEAIIEDKYPGKLNRFRENRKFSKMVYRRWKKDEDSRACVVIEVFYMILNLLYEKRPEEITEEDLGKIRIILEKIA